MVLSRLQLASVAGIPRTSSCISENTALLDELWLQKDMKVTVHDLAPLPDVEMTHLSKSVLVAPRLLLVLV